MHEDVFYTEKAIERYFKKHNAYPIPNILASEMLKVPYAQITTSKKDMLLNSTKERTQTISDYIQYGEYLLDDMQLLKLHVLNI